MIGGIEVQVVKPEGLLAFEPWDPHDTRREPRVRVRVRVRAL